MLKEPKERPRVIIRETVWLPSRTEVHRFLDDEPYSTRIAYDRIGQPSE